MAFFPVFLASVSLYLASAPEEKGERGAAGGCNPGLREDSHGEEQPPEGSRQDGQRHYSVHCTVHSLFNRSCVYKSCICM